MNQSLSVASDHELILLAPGLILLALKPELLVPELILLARQLILLAPESELRFLLPKSERRA
jgi:hypothetical protein